jgi:hypothetical protein
MAPIVRSYSNQALDDGSSIIQALGSKEESYADRMHRLVLEKYFPFADIIKVREAFLTMNEGCFYIHGEMAYRCCVKKTEYEKCLQDISLCVDLYVLDRASSTNKKWWNHLKTPKGCSIKASSEDTIGGIVRYVKYQGRNLFRLMYLPITSSFMHSEKSVLFFCKERKFIGKHWLFLNFLDILNHPLHYAHMFTAEKMGPILQFVENYELPASSEKKGRCKESDIQDKLFSDTSIPINDLVFHTDPERNILEIYCSDDSYRYVSPPLNIQRQISSTALNYDQLCNHVKAMLVKQKIGHMVTDFRPFLHYRGRHMTFTMDPLSYKINDIVSYLHEGKRRVKRIDDVQVKDGTWYYELSNDPEYLYSREEDQMALVHDIRVGDRVFLKKDKVIEFKIRDYDIVENAYVLNDDKKYKKTDLRKIRSEGPLIQPGDIVLHKKDHVSIFTVKQIAKDKYTIGRPGKKDREVPLSKISSAFHLDKKLIKEGSSVVLTQNKLPKYKIMRYEPTTNEFVLQRIEIANKNKYIYSVQGNHIFRNDPQKKIYYYDPKITSLYKETDLTPFQEGDDMTTISQVIYFGPDVRLLGETNGKLITVSVSSASERRAKLSELERWTPLGVGDVVSLHSDKGRPYEIKAILATGKNAVKYELDDGREVNMPDIRGINPVSRVPCIKLYDMRGFGILYEGTNKPNGEYTIKSILYHEKPILYELDTGDKVPLSCLQYTRDNTLREGDIVTLPDVDSLARLLSYEEGTGRVCKIVFTDKKQLELKHDLFYENGFFTVQKKDKIITVIPESEIVNHSVYDKNLQHVTSGDHQQQKVLYYSNLKVESIDGDIVTLVDKSEEVEYELDELERKSPLRVGDRVTVQKTITEIGHLYMTYIDYLYQLMKEVQDPTVDFTFPQERSFLRDFHLSSDYTFQDTMVGNVIPFKQESWMLREESHRAQTTFPREYLFRQKTEKNMKKRNQYYFTLRRNKFQ